MAPTKETKGVKAKAKAASKTDTKTKKAVAKATKGKYPILRPYLTAAVDKDWVYSVSQCDTLTL